MTSPAKDDAKRQELESLAANALSSCGAANADAIAVQVISHFTTITAPESPSVEFITLRPDGVCGARSTRPGNVVLNLRKFIVAIANGTLVVAGALVQPWMLILGALVVWNELWSSLQVDLSEAHASVVWAVWKDCDANQTIEKSAVLPATNRERTAVGLPPLNTQQFDRVVGDLVRMRCIKQSNADVDRWWLQEWVRVSYR